MGDKLYLAPLEKEKITVSAIQQFGVLLEAQFV